MNTGRRDVLALGGGLVAALVVPLEAGAGNTVEIVMMGTARGEHVWFEPDGVAVAPGTTIHFVNKDAGNSHTATAYSSKVNDRQDRIPRDAEPWDSGLLLPDETFDVTLTAPGVYDFYCQPHEMAGMVGRIVVGKPGDTGWQGPAADSDDLDAEVLKAFPAVDDILAKGSVNTDAPG